MAGAEIVVGNFWRIDLSAPNHVNDSCGGFGLNQQFFDTVTVSIPSHHQTYRRGRAGDEQDNGTVRIVYFVAPGFFWKISMVDTDGGAQEGIHLLG
jgi:hypothetical protein